MRDLSTELSSELNLINPSEIDLTGSLGSPDKFKALCHDVRHELGVVLALVEVIRGEPDLPDAPRQRLDQVIGVTARLADFLRDAVTTGETTTVDASATIREAVDNLAFVSRATFVCAIEDGIMFAADAYQTRRAVMNLLDNALRAAGPDGVVAVRLQQKYGCVVLEIEDSGPGMDAAPSGLASMGLSVVQEWVHAVGGRFSIGPSDRAGTLARVVVGPHAAAIIDEATL
jgi:signal transduction histidine kinase